MDTGGSMGYDGGMIGYLEGLVIHGEKNALIVRTGGVGYKVFVTPDVLEATKNKTVSLWIHSAVREDAFDLYGFPERETLEFFQLLIGVSGIGPRSALGILGLADVRTLRQAIASKDTAYLVKVSGIGKKTVEKIVLELQDKIDPITDLLPETGGELDAIEALKALGYDDRSARLALQKIPKTVTDAGERIKAALKQLAK